jgi:hypothetical protein
MSLRQAVLTELRGRFCLVQKDSPKNKYEFDLFNCSIMARCPFRAIWIAVQKEYIDVDSILGEFVASDDSDDTAEESRDTLSVSYVSDIIDFICGGMVL